MAQPKALAAVFADSDKFFFDNYPARYAHIRLPYKNESEGEFWSLGQHARKDRRILLWRLPPDNPHYDLKNPQIMKIPFLAFEEENIEDTDEALLPIIDTIMREAGSGGT